MKNFRSILAIVAVAAMSFGTALAGGDNCKDKDCCKGKSTKTASKKAEKSEKSNDKPAEAKKS